MIDRNTHLTISVRTYTHYTECELWCQANIGEWNIDWWRDFPDIAAAVIIQGPHEDCYWFHNEQSALMFRLKFR
jgi:hypothetical protein